MTAKIQSWVNKELKKNGMEFEVRVLETGLKALEL